MQTFVYEVLAGGIKVGVTIAPNAATALDQALKAFTRRTNSKMDEVCDYDDLYVNRFPIFKRSQVPAPAPRHNALSRHRLAA